MVWSVFYPGNEKTLHFLEFLFELNACIFFSLPGDDCPRVAFKRLRRSESALFDE